MLVGRAAERGRIAACLASFQSVLVVGEVGAGKTALVAAVCREAAEATFVGGALPSLSMIPYLPLARATRELPRGAPSEVVASVAACVGGGLLLLEDLQWSDPATLAALPLLTSCCRVIATARRNGIADETVLATARAVGMQIVVLAPLDDSAVDELLQAAHPELTLAERVGIVARASGNPAIALTLGKTGSVSLSLWRGLSQRLDCCSAGAVRLLAKLALAECPLSDHDTAALDELVELEVATRQGGEAVLRHRVLGELALARFDAQQRTELHSEIAQVVEPRWAPLHLAAAGKLDAARTTACSAAENERDAERRARLLEIAARVAPAPEALRVDAALALLDTGRAGEAEELLVDAAPSAAAQLVRCIARREAGDVRAARAASEAFADGPAALRARLLLERARLLAWPFWEPNAVQPLLPLVPDADREILDLLVRFQCGEDVEAYARALAFADHPGRRIAAALAAVCGARRADAAAVAQALASTDDSDGLLAAAIALHSQADADVTLPVLQRLVDDAATRDRDIAAAHLALALADVGRSGEALGVLADAASRPASPVGGATLAWVQAETEMLAGRTRRARIAAAHCAETNPQGFPVGDLCDLTIAWLALEDEAPLTELSRDPWVPAIRQEWHALQLHVAGETLAAADAFEEAAEGWAGIQARSVLRCSWGAGECLRRAGRRDEAVERWSAVETEADRLQLRPMVARVRASLRLVGVRRNPHRGATAHGLSAREQQVLALVGEGLSTREVALQLGIAPTTVDTQVESAVRKLGARSRRQAAAMYSEIAGA